jgi:hypothetical protein
MSIWSSSMRSPRFGIPCSRQRFLSGRSGSTAGHPMDKFAEHLLQVPNGPTVPLRVAPNSTESGSFVSGPLEADGVDPK